MKNKLFLFCAVSCITTTAFTSKPLLAAPTVYSGTSCHNYEGYDANTIAFYSYGVVNLGKNPKYPSSKVICPVTKRGSDYNGLQVRINLDSPGPKRVKCTLYSYNWADEEPLATQSGYSRTNGKESILLKVANSTPRSHFSVLCDLPYKDSAAIYSIEAFN
jgi:hypothetical protein